MTATPELPRRGHRLCLDGNLVTVETATATDTGLDLIVRGPDGALIDRTVTWEQLVAAGVPENDGQGRPPQALAGLWGRWMQYALPRLRSAALATRPLKQYAHQDEALRLQLWSRTLSAVGRAATAPAESLRIPWALSRPAPSRRSPGKRPARELSFPQVSLFRPVFATL
jgi:hypothetical protein